MNIEEYTILINQRAQPKTFTMQINDAESHFTVTVPST